MYFRTVILALLLLFFCLNQAFPQCSVSITPNPATACSGSNITLTANTANTTAPVSYSWTGGGTGSSISVAPATPTSYTVNISDGAGCTATATVLVNVNPSPTAGFTFNNNNVCGGTAVSFTSSVSGGQAPYIYAWNFGGAGTSAQANPVFTFNPSVGTGTQTYNVILTVTDNRGCTATATQTVTIRRKPDAAIADQDIFTPWVFCDSSGGLQLLIDNTSTTQATNTNYNIDWGDGSAQYNAATLPNGTSHTYSGQGYFNLALTVTGTNGCTATTTYDIFSGGNPEIGLANPGGTVNICATKEITFPITNYSNNPPGTTYTITVNDGSAPAVFNHPPPASYTHTFDISSCGFTSLGGFANAFHVRIVAENPCGTTAALVEPIRLGSPPVADYTFTPPPDICVGDVVDFTSTAEGTFNNNGTCTNTLAGGWNITPATGWTLVTGSLTTPNPISVNFSQHGTYNVRLIASNPCGSDTTIKQVCVAQPPDANFTLPSLSGCAPLTLPATNTSNTINTCENTIYAWAVTHNGSLCTSGGSWSFQSGSATSQSPTFQFTGSGTYTVSLTLSNNCGISTEIKTVTVDKVPELAIAPLPNICAGNTITPTALINNCYSTLSNVNWSFPGGNPNASTAQNPGAVTYNGSGTFTVTLSATNSCGTSTDNETFTIAPPPPVPVLSSNSPRCAGQTITINANTIAGVTYTWTGPIGFTSNQQNVTLNSATSLQSGTYTLVVTDVLGCTNTASIDIVINAPPIITVNNPAPLCVGGSVQLTAGGGLTYTWSPATGLSATTGSTVTANPTTTTTYTVTGTDGNGCSNTATVLVTINPLPNISVTQPPAICVGQSTLLTATGGVSYTWSPATGLSATSGAIVTANPTTTTTYTITGTDVNGCSNTTTTTVTVNPLPNVTVNNPAPVCAGQSATLTANGANSYTWSPPAGLSATTGQSVTASPLITTIYTVTGSNGGCTNAAQVTVTVNQLPIVSVNSGTVCAGNSLVLNASGANSYTWSPATGLNATTGQSVTATPASTTLYTVTGTDGNGCGNTAIATVTISPNPAVDAGADQTLCNQNIPVQLNATPPGGTWSGDGVSSVGIFNPVTAGVGTHSLTYNFSNGSGCSGSDIVVITVVPPTIPNAKNNFSVCRNDAAIDLNAHNNPAPSGGTWSGPGVVLGIFTPALAADGPNTIIYTTGTGTCEASDDIIITVHPQPNITVNEPSICAGETATLNASGAISYNWSPATGLSATTGASVTANPAATITYTITGTDVNSCTNTTTTTVTVNPLPAVDAGNDQTLCEQNTTVQLNGSPNNGTWSGNAVTPGGSFNPATAGTGIHQITYSFTDGNGCSNSDDAQITVVTLSVPVAGNDLTFCRDAAVTDLNTQNPTPSGGTWSGTGVSGNNFDPATAAIGQNTVTYSFGTGTCLATDAIIITVHALPTLNVNAPTICAGGSATLTANGASSYTWSPATGLSATSGTTVIANPTSTTLYSITGTDINNCVNTTTSTVIVNPLPVVDAGAPQTFCDQNIPVQLNGTPANGSWTGNGVSAGGSFNPATAGVGAHLLTYSFTDNNSCSNSDTVTMTVIIPTIANSGFDFALCVDASPVDLNAQNNPTPSGGTWTGAGVANNIFIAANAVIGQNEIIYSIGSGTCLSMDTVEITVNALPVINVNSPTICESGSAILNATGAVNYAWTPANSLSDSVGPSVTASPIVTTVYTVRGTDANTCVNSTDATVFVNQLPAVDAGAPQVFCDQNIPVQLTGTPANGSWTGNGVSTGGSFNPSGAGVGTHLLTYSFTDNNNCSNSDTVTMTVIIPTIANAGNDFPVCVDAIPVDLNAQNNPTPAGGTWTGAGVANNFFTAANAMIGQNEIVYSIGSGTCLSMDTVEITVNALPVINVNSPTICESGSAILNATGAVNYAWTPANTLSDSVGPSVTASPIVTTVYTVRGTDANTCVNSTDATVFVNQLPAVDAGAPQIFCDQNIPVQLTGTPANGSWTGNGVSISGSFNPSGAGVGTHLLTYSFTDNNNCSNSDTVTMTVIIPTIANAGNDFPVCVDATPVDLNAQNNPTPAGGTWTGAGVANNFFTAANAMIGQNEIVYSIGSGTCLSMDTIEITVNALPVINVNSPTICESGSAILNATGAISYAWTPTNTLSDSVGPSVTASPIVTTVYTVRGTDANTCVNSTNATVFVNQLPAVDAGAPQVFCDQNIPVQLTGTPANGSWTGNGVSISGSFNPSGAGVGTHLLTYSFTDNNSCTNSDTVTMAVIAPTLANAGNDFPLCRNAIAVDLNTQNNPTPAGGTWTGAGVSNNFFDPAIATFGQNEIIYTIGTGTCLTRDTIQATVNPLPLVNVNSGAMCADSLVTLTCTGADIYSWAPMTGLTIISGAVAEASPPVTTAYTITGTDTNGCADTAQAIVVVHPLPAVDAGPDRSTCNQPQFPTQLVANPSTGTWSGNFITPGGLFTPGGTPADTGAYTITYSYTDGNGCDNTDQAIIIVTAPVYAVAGPDKTFCFDDPAGILTGFSPAGGTWSGAGIVDGTTGLFNPSVAGVGSATLRYQYGSGTCATRDSVIITINPVPMPALSFNTTCINDTTFFTDLSIANIGTVDTWLWDFGGGNTSSDQNPSLIFPTAGNHTITFEVVNSAGCSTDTAFTLTVHPLPTVSFTHDTMICPDSALQLTLTAVDALHYSWDFGDGTTGTGINPTHSYTNVGVYEIKLIAETQFGCVDSATSRVRVPEPPNAFFTFNPKAGCAPLDVAFYPLLPPDWTGLRYMWVFGNGDTTFSPIPPDHVIYNAGANGRDTSYIVEFYVFSHTCQNFGKYTDTVKVLNTPPAVVSADFTIGCGQTNALFTNTNNTVFDSLYIDYGDGAAEVIAASDATFNHTFANTTNAEVTYTVTYYATGATCSSAPGTIPITVYPNTVKAGIIASPQDVCLGETITITNNASGASYFYYDLGTGIVSPVNTIQQSVTLNLTDTGSFTIYQHVYSADSCSFGKDSLIVRVHSAPVGNFEFEQPSSGCSGSEIVFHNLSSGHSSSVWDFGDNTTVVGDAPVHRFEQQGTYVISLFTENAIGCQDTLAKPITIDFLEKGLYVPNAFSPEFGDPKVREFKPAGQCMESYHLHIYNTWGELLWETYSLTPNGEPAEGWNGRHMKTGVLVPQDVYVWKIEAVFMNSSVWTGKEYDDGRVKKIGSVTLLR